MSRISSLGTVKSVQSGVIVISNNSSTGAKSNTATISSIDLNKYALLNLGCYSDFTLVSGGAAGAILSMSNSTTVTATYRSVTTSAENMTVGYEVLEYL
jgi:hypothetical protein